MKLPSQKNTRSRLNTLKTETLVERKARIATELSKAKIPFKVIDFKSGRSGQTYSFFSTKYNVICTCPGFTLHKKCWHTDKN